MAMSRKMRSAVAYERLSYRRGVSIHQYEQYQARAAKLRREDARDKEHIKRMKERKPL
jgi:hypothetical protein